VEIRLLGPVEVWQGGRQLRLRAGRQRTVLAVLALRVGHPVSVTELVDAVWAEDPPVTVRQQIHSTVSALRRAGCGPVVSTPGGYRLQVPRDRVDAYRFDAAVTAARGAAAGGDVAAAVAGMRQALGLWRGPALADIPGLAAQAARLDESRLEATEECVELELRLGHHATLVPELTELVAMHPLRERLVGQLMLALYAAGRRADALEVYRQTAKRLTTELGLDPGEHLRTLELAVLRADPALNAPAAAPGFPPGAAGRLPVPTPEQLPPGVVDFVGRDCGLATLTALAPPASPPNGGRPPAPAVVISAVSGTAGVGKTALALHWAHRVRDRFPDGQLFVNLRGFDASGSELTSAEAVRGFLDALGVAAQHVPVGLAAQTALYRSLLSRKRMLVVLDNARDSEQVRPLLPGEPGCLVVVTSRDRLDSLVAIDGARPLTLDLLSVDEARQMLVHRLGAEPEAADEIIDLCARLPLALAIVCARAAGHPRFPLAALAGELADARGGLDALTGADAATDVRVVFS
jgi:DNA-binding SARP family transcriptional activator